jgi:hypothetical protein
VTLIKSGLDDEEFESPNEPAAVNGTWRAATRLLTSVGHVLLPRDRRNALDAPPTRTRWTAGDAGTKPGSGGSVSTSRPPACTRPGKRHGTLQPEICV